MRKVFKILGLVFGLIGLLMIVGGCIFYFVNKSYEKRFEFTEGRIVSVTSYGDDQHDVKVEYTIMINDVSTTLQNEINYFSSSMRVGDKIKIFYSLDNINKIYYQEFTSAIVFLCIGFVLSIVGIVLFILFVIKNNKVKRLLSDGKKITCQIVSIDENYHIMINNRPVFNIKCECVDEIYEKKSTYISEYVSFWQMKRDWLGKNVYVYVSRENDKDYYVDLKTIFGESQSIQSTNKDQISNDDMWS